MTGRTRFYIDGECIVDYLDPQPLESGWFGFRTTLSRTRITNFRSYETPSLFLSKTGVPLHWVGHHEAGPVSFGVPFAQGELKDVSTLTLSGDIPTDAWVNASWPDGSVKWAGLAAVVPEGVENLKLVNGKKKDGQSMAITTNRQIVVNTGRVTAYLPKDGAHLIDSLCLDGKRIGGTASLTATTDIESYQSQIKKIEVERCGYVRAVIKMEGVHRSNAGREWLPFIVRLYFYRGSEQIRLVHTFIYDGDEHQDMIRSLGIRLQIPMREEAYNRHIAFATDNCIWTEPVQPFDGRRPIIMNGDRHRNLQAEQMEGKRIPEYSAFDDRNRELLDHWAKWDGYRLSQLTDNSYSIRKRATSESPWIGTLTGTHSPGYAFVGDVSGGVGVCLKDFWQSYPSTIQIDKARSDEAELTMYPLES